MDVQATATEIVKILQEAGYNAYFAGGWVRDFLLGHPSSDIDIATNASPETILNLFPNTLLVGMSFGVVIVTLNGKHFEVATFREEGPYLDGRRPIHVKPASAEQDAKRRDFTINGMFYDPIMEKLHDFVGGKEDLERKMIRTIGNPQDRFKEDRLRLIRAVRFSTRLGFELEKKTEEAIVLNAHTLFPSVAAERLWQEFKKMAEAPHFNISIQELHRLGLLPAIFPSLQHVDMKTIEKRVSAYRHFPRSCPVLLLITHLFPEASYEQLVEIGLQLKVSNRDLKVLESLNEFKKMLEREYHNESPIEPVEWAHLYADPHMDLCLHVLAASYSDRIRSHFIHEHKERKLSLLPHIERIISRKPLISAALLTKEGVQPGKLMGLLLKEAERLVINRDLSQEQEALALLKTSEIWPKKG